jgi:uncharacterized protein YciI
MAELKEWLYVLRPARIEMMTEGATDEEKRIVAEHFAYHERLTEQGVHVLVGRTQNNDAGTLGLVIFRAESEEAARAIMQNDPTVKHGVMTATLYPYKIALQGK